MNNWYTNNLHAVENQSPLLDESILADMLGEISNDDVPNTPMGVSNSTVATTEVPPWDPFHPPYAIRVPRAVYSIIGIYMSFVLVLAVVFNGLVLYTAYKNRVVRTPLNYIVINLTAADLIGAVCGNTLNVMANIASGFFLGKPMCVIEGATASVAGVAGLMSVAVMAFERYFVVCKPFGPVHFTDRHAYLGVIFTWVYSFAWHIPMMFLYNGFEAEGFGTNCAPNYWLTDTGPRVFLVVYFFGCFVFPYTAIFLSYGKLIMSLREMKKASMVTSTSNVSADQEVTKMVVVLVLAFAVCWFPYATVAMTNVFLTEKIYEMGAIPAFFAKSAAVYNPLIYIGLNKQFRDCVMKTIFKGILPKEEGNASMLSSVASNKTAPAS